MKKSILVPILTIFVAAAVLFGVAAGLTGVASANAQKEHLEMMRLLLPDSETFTLEPYSGDDANIRSVHKAENGYIIETCCYGFAGDITMLIGVSSDGRVTGLVVRDMEETWTLGAEALTDHVFLSQFLNKSGEFAVAAGDSDASSSATPDSAPVSGDAQEVDALTGATVTTRAVIRCVNSAVSYVTGADVDTSATP